MFDSVFGCWGREGEGYACKFDMQNAIFLLLCDTKVEYFLVRIIWLKFQEVIPFANARWCMLLFPHFSCSFERGFHMPLVMKYSSKNMKWEVFPYQSFSKGHEKKCGTSSHPQSVPQHKINKYEENCIYIGEEIWRDKPGKAIQNQQHSYFWSKSTEHSVCAHELFCIIFRAKKREKHGIERKKRIIHRDEITTMKQILI